MGFFDELKKIISGNDLHDQPDSYASNPPQQIRDDEYFEAEGWTTIDKRQIWQKGRIFCFVERTRPARKMVCRFGPHAGQELQVAAKTMFGFSGVDPRKNVQIEYLNFEEERKTFTACLGSLQKKKNSIHISAIVLPKKIRIALNTERILNSDTLPAIPTRRERRKIASQLRKGTTNPEYEKLRSHFPVFAPLLPTSQEKRVMTFHENRGSTSPLFEQIKAKFTPPTEKEDSSAEITEETIVAESKPEPELATMDVIITDCGLSTHDALKLLQELKPDMSYYDISTLLRDFPQMAFENLPPEEAEAIKIRLEAAGCTVELK